MRQLVGLQNMRNCNDKIYSYRVYVMIRYTHTEYMISNDMILNGNTIVYTDMQCMISYDLINDYLHNI